MCRTPGGHDIHQLACETRATEAIVRRSWRFTSAQQSVIKDVMGGNGQCDECDDIQPLLVRNRYLKPRTAITPVQLSSTLRLLRLQQFFINPLVHLPSSSITVSVSPRVVHSWVNLNLLHRVSASTLTSSVWSHFSGKFMPFRHAHDM